MNNEEIFSLMVKQAPVNSLINLIILIALGILAWTTHKLISYKIQLANSDERDHWIELYVLFYIILFGVCFALGAGGFFGNIITGFINPEYWALKQL